MKAFSADELRERVTNVRQLAQRRRPRRRRTQDVDFEAEGLLAGADSEEDREARTELLEQLLDAGYSVDELRDAIGEERLTLLPVERVLRGEGEYTLAEVAEGSGLSEDFVRRHLAAVGLGGVDESEHRFDDDDVDAAKLLRELLDAGIPEEGILDVARVLGQAMSRTAESIATVMGETFLQAGDTERDLGLRYAEATEQLAPVMEPLLSYVLRLHLLQLVRSEVVDRATLSSGEFPGASEITVCFADIVGFTRLGEELPADELERVAGRLMDIASEEVESPARLVKSIGDAVMLVSSDPVPLIDAALRILNRADDEGERFPPLRVGLAQGQAIRRGGDWYGRPVNVASRVTDIARPASVLATAGVREAIEEDARDGFSWSSAGRRKIKGLNAPLTLYRVRRAEEGGGSPRREKSD